MRLLWRSNESGGVIWLTDRDPGGADFLLEPTVLSGRLLRYLLSADRPDSIVLISLVSATTAGIDGGE